MLNLLNHICFYIMKLIATYLLLTFYRVRVVNSHLIPKKGPLIIVANHTSYIDPVVLQVVFPKRVIYMMTSVFYETWGKWFFKLHRCISIKHKGLNKEAIKKGLKVLHENGTLGIFPEGGVSIDGCIHDWNSGIGFLAQKSGVCILPVYISGTFQLFPKGAKFPRIARVKVIFGEPMRFIYKKEEGLDRKRWEIVSNRILERITTLAATR